MNKQELIGSVADASGLGKGDASKAVFASGEVSWKRSQDSTVLDSKKLLQAHPELLNQYSTIRAGSRRFLIRT